MTTRKCFDTPSAYLENAKLPENAGSATPVQVMPSGAARTFHFPEAAQFYQTLLFKFNTSQYLSIIAKFEGKNIEEK